MRINSEMRKKIIEDYKTGKYTYASLEAKYGISRTSIGRILNPEYYEREKEKNKIRQRAYDAPPAQYTVNLRFYAQEQALIDKVKASNNKQQYIKGLIKADIDKEDS